MPRSKVKKTLRVESEVTREVLDACRIWGLALERRNAGGWRDERGHYIFTGKTGGADWHGTIPAGPSRGKRIEVEIKREGFDPRKLKSESKARCHFDDQIAFLEGVNLAGGFGLWVDSGTSMTRFLAMAMTQPGLWIAFEDGFPVMVYNESEAL